MRYPAAISIIAAVLTLIPVRVWASPVNLKRQDPGTIANAVNQWSQDTSTVSGFLNQAINLSGEDSVTQARIALNAEVDELNQKAVLDSAFLATNADIQMANNILVTQGTFQMVVSLLQDMVNNGAAAVGDVGLINAVRCPDVLPAIDMYFAVASKFLGNGVAILATRPAACS